MEKALYEATEAKYAPTPNSEDLKVKVRLLDGHFYDDVHFAGTLSDLIGIIENGEMLHMVKANGDKIFLNTKLLVDFVLS